MKVLFYVSFIISFPAISCAGQNKKPYPIFILNDKYNQIQKQNSNVTPQNYQLSSLNGFTPDCSRYDFSLIKTINDNKAPDVVNVISKTGTFTVKLNTNRETIIDSSTMKSLDGNNKKFLGFTRGDKVMLAIGTNKKNEMTTYWLGMINVK